MITRVVAGVVATTAILVLATDNREPHLSRVDKSHTYTCTYETPEHVDAEAFVIDVDGPLYCYDN